MTDSTTRGHAFSFTASPYGYMLAYKGQNIGGAAALDRGRKSAATAAEDLAAFTAVATREVAALKSGEGSKRYWDGIARIDRVVPVDHAPSLSRSATPGRDP